MPTISIVSYINPIMLRKMRFLLNDAVLMFSNVSVITHLSYLFFIPLQTFAQRIEGNQSCGQEQ